MSLFFRYLWVLLRARRAPATSLWGTGRKTFRVRLRDLDLNLHLNNSVYLLAFDLARMDLVVRSGSWAAQQRHGVNPVIAAQTVTYRRSLKWRDRYDVETRVAGVDDQAAYFHQRITVRGEIYAEALARVRFVRTTGGVAPTTEVLALSEPMPADRVLQPWMKDWAAGTTLPSTRQPAPSDW